MERSITFGPLVVLRVGKLGGRETVFDLFGGIFFVGPYHNLILLLDLVLLNAKLLNSYAFILCGCCFLLVQVLGNVRYLLNIRFKP